MLADLLVCSCHKLEATDCSKFAVQQQHPSMGMQVVGGEQRRGQKVMVFCNTLDSCRAADKFLQEHGLPSLTYHGDVPLDGCRQAILNFAQGGDSATRNSADGRSASDQPVLVCTDLAAR